MRAQIIVQGLACMWEFAQDISSEEIERMRADGLPVNIILSEEDVDDETAEQVASLGSQP